MKHVKKMAFVCAALLASPAQPALAASHNDAPLIHEDPPANITDVYTYITQPPGEGKKIVVILQSNPLEVPGDGINYYRFSDDVKFTLHFDRARPDGTFALAGPSDVAYEFTFLSRLLNDATAFLYGVGDEIGPIQTAGGPSQNLQQVFFVRKSINGGREIPLIPDSGCLIPPVNVGPRTTPKYYQDGGTTVIQGANSFAELDEYTRSTVYQAADGSRVFAGQRDDGFYSDVAAIFDLLGIRSPGIDTFAGFNVQVIAIEIPLENIVPANEVPIVGVHATASRRREIPGNVMLGGRARTAVGKQFVQVARMGNPLFNEVLVAQMDKDLFNVTDPVIDDQQFRIYAANPEIAGLINLVFGTNIQTTNREDLVQIFIPDVLKLDTSTAPVPLPGDPNFDRLSLFGAPGKATVFSPYQNKQIPAGWPNGRRIGDDVIDIALTAIASGPDFSTITPLSDNVDSNDVLYNRVFPYAATPHGGPTSSLNDPPLNQ